MYDDIGGGPAPPRVPSPNGPLETPVMDALQEEMYNYTRLSGKSTANLDCILITYDDCRNLEIEMGEMQYRGFPTKGLLFMSGGQLIFRGVSMVRVDRGRMLTPEFIFVPKTRIMAGGSNASITMGLEEYNIRMETMRTSFDTAMGLTKEKVKRRSRPKALADVRRRKLRWD